MRRSECKLPHLGGGIFSPVTRLGIAVGANAEERLVRRHVTDRGSLIAEKPPVPIGGAQAAARIGDIKDFAIFDDFHDLDDFAQPIENSSQNTVIFSNFFTLKIEWKYSAFLFENQWKCVVIPIENRMALRRTGAR